MASYQPDQVPMVEVAPGVRAHRIIDRPQGSGAITVGELEVEPGASLPLHRHRVEEVVIVLGGIARFDLDGVVDEAGPGTMLLAPAGAPHSLTCMSTEPLRVYFAFPSVDVDREWVSRP
jgi:quercetin dioxygenase-like cupin family protein